MRSFPKHRPQQKQTKKNKKKITYRQSVFGEDANSLVPVYEETRLVCAVVLIFWHRLLPPHRPSWPQTGNSFCLLNAEITGSHHNSSLSFCHLYREKKCICHNCTDWNSWNQNTNRSYSRESWPVNIKQQVVATFSQGDQLCEDH